MTTPGDGLIERGFTLVELLIVIVILGILAGIVVFAVGNMTTNAKATGCAAEKTHDHARARVVQGVHRHLPDRGRGGRRQPHRHGSPRPAMPRPRRRSARC